MTLVLSYQRSYRDGVLADLDFRDRARRGGGHRAASRGHVESPVFRVFTSFVVG
jgi:hypothetical protein